MMETFMTKTATAPATQWPKCPTRHGLEEWVSDCVIVLDHRVTDQIATRHLLVGLDLRAPD